jgi:hypothetical protein
VIFQQGFNTVDHNTVIVYNGNFDVRAVHWIT